MKRTTEPHSGYKPEMFRLSNGIPVIIDIVPSVESCAIGVWINAGTRDEGRRKAGVAHLVEHTSFRRTATRTMARISKDFENAGAFANAYTTKEETCYEVRTLSDSFIPVFDTLADVVTGPVFAEADIQRERGIIIEEIKSYEDEAEEFIFDAGEAQIFGNHPLAVPIVGTVESVRTLSAADVRSFHDRYYHAKGMVITVSGNVDPDVVVRLAEKHFSSVPKGRVPKRSKPTVLPPTAIELHRQLQQAHVLWQVPTPGQTWADRYALLLLSTVLGDGMTSRLNVRIRERRGLAYTVYSSVQLFTDCGTMAIYAGVEDSNIDTVHTLIRRELTELALHGITPAELARARRQVHASKVMALESLTARMSMLGKGWLEDGKPEDPREVHQRLTGVTLQDVQRVAEQLCTPEAWSTCTILPVHAE
jgi:predicted Zn-dependent peptidase